MDQQGNRLITCPHWVGGGRPGQGRYGVTDGGVELGRTGGGDAAAHHRTSTKMGCQGKQERNNKNDKKKRKIHKQLLSLIAPLVSSIKPLIKSCIVEDFSFELLNVSLSLVY